MTSSQPDGRHSVMSGDLSKTLRLSGSCLLNREVMRGLLVVNGTGSSDSDWLSIVYNG